jgi:hypothetical protein
MVLFIFINAFYLVDSMYKSSRPLQFSEVVLFSQIHFNAQLLTRV